MCCLDGRRSTISLALIGPTHHLPAFGLRTSSVWHQLSAPITSLTFDAESSGAHFDLDQTDALPSNSFFLNGGCRTCMPACWDGTYTLTSDADVGLIYDESNVIAPISGCNSGVRSDKPLSGGNQFDVNQLTWRFDAFAFGKT